MTVKPGQYQECCMKGPPLTRILPLPLTRQFCACMKLMITRSFDSLALIWSGSPASQSLDSRLFVRELVPRSEPRPVLRPSIVSEPFTDPPVHHANISGCDSVTLSWHG